MLFVLETSYIDLAYLYLEETHIREEDLLKIKELEDIGIIDLNFKVINSDNLSLLDITAKVNDEYKEFIKDYYQRQNNSKRKKIINKIKSLMNKLGELILS